MRANKFNKTAKIAVIDTIMYCVYFCIKTEERILNLYCCFSLYSV